MRRFSTLVIPVLSALAIGNPFTSLPKAVAQPTPVTANISSILPDRLPLVVLINTRREAWQNLGQQFDLFPKTLDVPINIMIPPFSSFDMTQDIRPWLGDQAAFVILPPPATTAASGTTKPKFDIEAQLVIALAVKDKAVVSDFLKKVKQFQGSKPTERQYKNVTLIEWKVDGGNSPNTPSLNYDLAIALVGEVMIVAPKAAAIEAIIDSQANLQPLAQNQRFQKTLTKPEAKNSLLIGYIDIKPFIEFNNKLLEAAWANLEEEGNFPKIGRRPDVDQWLADTFDTIDVMVWPQQDGLYGRTSANFTRSSPSVPLGFSKEPLFLPSANQILSQVPGTTYTAGNATNPAAYWRETIAVLTADTELKKLLPEFRQQMKSFLGVDDRDIFAWMDGEAALFAYPTRGGALTAISPNFNMGIGVVVQTSNRKAGEAMLRQLEATLRNFVTIQSQSIKGQTITSWEIPTRRQRQSVFAYGWADDRTLILSTGQAPLADIFPKPFTSLPQSANFRTAIQPLSGANQPNNSGYFYVNMGTTLAFIFNTIVPEILTGQDMTPEGEAILRSFVRGQQAYYLEKGRFASQIAELQMGIDADTPSHLYRIVPGGDLKQRVVITAQARRAGERSYTAALIATRTPSGEEVTVIGLCETLNPSNKLPGIPKFAGFTQGGYSFKCPANARIPMPQRRTASTPLPPDIAALQQQLSTMRSFSATTSFLPDQMRFDAVLQIAPARRR